MEEKFTFKIRSYNDRNILHRAIRTEQSTINHNDPKRGESRRAILKAGEEPSRKHWFAKRKPTPWKNTKMVLTFKKVNQKDLKNYRHVY